MDIGILGSGAVLPLEQLPDEQSPNEIAPRARAMSEAETLWRRAQGIPSIGTAPDGAVVLRTSANGAQPPAEQEVRPVERPAPTTEPEGETLPPIITENEETVPL